ncbi:MAG TPA: hypothetical protein VNM45_04275 [Bacillus sp. (in: firmicutes)]|nr:hypothetical protein [Bacillus sp. (in: firmicutes)]
MELDNVEKRRRLETLELLNGKPLFGFMGRSETTERSGAAARQ